MKKSKINYLDIKTINTGHINNKNEGKLLRKLMSETGLSESELRGIKKYRKMLSDVQDHGENPTTDKRTKYINSLIKRVTKEVGLAKEHPLVIAKYREILTEKQRLYQVPWFMIGFNL